MLKTATLFTLLSIGLTGCVVPTQYEKTYSVTKDANGRIISTTETERVTQPAQQGRGYPIRLEHIQGIQPEPTPFRASEFPMKNGQ